jgi:hypothetical protein
MYPNEEKSSKQIKSVQNHAKRTNLAVNDALGTIVNVGGSVGKQIANILEDDVGNLQKRFNCLLHIFPPGMQFLLNCSELGITNFDKGGDDKDLVKRSYKAVILRGHPDKGGNGKRINAVMAARKELLSDLEHSTTIVLSMKKELVNVANDIKKLKSEVNKLRRLSMKKIAAESKTKNEAGDSRIVTGKPSLKVAAMPPPLFKLPEEEVSRKGEADLSRMVAGKPSLKVTAMPPSSLPSLKVTAMPPPLFKLPEEEVSRKGEADLSRMAAGKPSLKVTAMPPSSFQLSDEEDHPDCRGVGKVGASGLRSINNGDDPYVDEIVATKSEPSYINQESSPQQELMNKCLDLVEQLRTDEHGWMFAGFLHPVDLGLDDRFEFIKNPMDFGKIKDKLTAGSYRSLEDFHSDVSLTFENAMKIEDTKIHEMTKKLKNKFVVAIEELVKLCRVSANLPSSTRLTLSSEPRQDEPRQDVSLRIGIGKSLGVHDDDWTCVACTCVNPKLHLLCSACGSTGGDAAPPVREVVIDNGLTLRKIVREVVVDNGLTPRKIGITPCSRNGNFTYAGIERYNKIEYVLRILKVLVRVKNMPEVVIVDIMSYLYCEGIVANVAVVDAPPSLVSPSIDMTPRGGGDDNGGIALEPAMAFPSDIHDRDPSSTKSQAIGQGTGDCVMKDDDGVSTSPTNHLYSSTFVTSESENASDSDSTLMETGMAESLQDIPSKRRHHHDLSILSEVNDRKRPFRGAFSYDYDLNLGLNDEEVVSSAQKAKRVNWATEPAYTECPDVSMLELDNSGPEHIRGGGGGDDDDVESTGMVSPVPSLCYCAFPFGDGWEPCRLTFCFCLGEFPSRTTSSLQRGEGPPMMPPGFRPQQAKKPVSLRILST